MYKSSMLRHNAILPVPVIYRGYLWTISHKSWPIGNHSLQSKPSEALLSCWARCLHVDPIPKSPSSSPRTRCPTTTFYWTILCRSGQTKSATTCSAQKRKQRVVRPLPTGLFPTETSTSPSRNIHLHKTAPLTACSSLRSAHHTPSQGPRTCLWSR